MAENHCGECHENWQYGDRHIWKCSPKTLVCPVCPSPALNSLEKEVQTHIQEKGSVEKAEGIFGDNNQNFGFIKRQFHAKEPLKIKTRQFFTIKGKTMCVGAVSPMGIDLFPAWSGTFKSGVDYSLFVPKEEIPLKLGERNLGQVTEFYGVSYLYKGTLFGDTLSSVAVTKRTLMASAELLLKYWFFLSPLALIFWKTSVKAFVYWFAQIYEADLKQKTYKYLSEFSPVPREVIRAGLKLADKIPIKAKFFEDMWDRKEFESEDSQEYRIRVRRIIWCIGTFIQSDSAYYKRVQDALSNLNKLWLNNSRQEILRLFDLVLSREKTISDKVRKLMKLVSILLLFPPFLKIARSYLYELEPKEFEPDDSDRYYNSRVQGYDFEGKPYAERKEWADKKDKELGHTIIST